MRREDKRGKKKIPCRRHKKSGDEERGAASWLLALEVDECVHVLSFSSFHFFLSFFPHITLTSFFSRRGELSDALLLS